MNCKRCGSSNLRTNGKKLLKNGPVQQYRCNSCGHQFTSSDGSLAMEDFGKQTAKILLLDIETAPMHCRVWRLGKQVVGMEQIINDWFILGWSAKWLFDYEVASEFVTPEEAKDRDDRRVLEILWKLMNDASIIIGHNIKYFDIPNIYARFIYYHIGPPSPFQMLDTLQSSKSIGLTSHKLKYITEYLDLKKKLDTNYQLWIDCENGDEKSLAYMEKYCRQDSIALEEVFVELRPYLKTGINMALHNHSGEACCSSCGSPDLEEKGYYYTSVSRFTSYRCKHCGSYSRSRENDLSIKDKKVLLSPTAR